MSGDQIERSICQWISAIGNLSINEFDDLKRGNEIFEVLKLIDLEYFSAWEKDIFSDYEICEESQITLFSKENWFVITKSIDSYLEKIEMEEIQLNSDIQLLADGDDDEMINFFFSLFTLFLIKKKELWDSSINKLTDPSDREYMQNIAQNILHDAGIEDNNNDDDLVQFDDSPDGKKRLELMGHSPGSSAILYKVDSLESEVQNLKEEKKNLEDEIYQKDNEIERLTNSLQERNEDFKKIKEMRANNSKEELDKEKEKVAMLTHKLSLCEGQIDMLEFNLKNTKDDKQKLEIKNSELLEFQAKFEDVKNHMKYNEDLKNRVSKMKREQRQKEIQMDGLKQNIELYKKQFESLNKKFSEEKDTRFNLMKENEDLKIKNKQNIREIEELENLVLKLKNKDSKPGSGSEFENTVDKKKLTRMQSTEFEEDEDPYEHIEYLENLIEELKDEKERGWLDNNLVEDLRKTEDDLRNKLYEKEKKCQNILQENKQLKEKIDEIKNENTENIKKIKETQKIETQRKTIMDTQMNIAQDQKNNDTTLKILYNMVQDLTIENDILKNQRRKNNEKKFDFIKSFINI